MKIDLMFGMLITIINKKRVTAYELSLKYELSKRTVYRYINALCAAQVPIVSYPGRFGGFSLADNFTLNRTFFTKKELNYFLDIFSGMEYLFINKQLTSSIKDKISSLTFIEDKHSMASGTIFIDSGPWGDISSYRGKMIALEECISGTKEAGIVYHDANGDETSRTVHPYTLVFKQGIWYVYAYCTLRKDFRLFKVGRIASIAVSDKNFKKREIDVQKLPYSLNWFDNGDNVNIVLEINKQVRSEIEEWLSFENVKEHKDGKLYAFAQLPESGLIPKLLSYGSNIKVLKPPYIKEKLLNTISGIKEKYEEK